MVANDLVAFLRARLDEDERWAQDSASPLYSDGEPGTPGHSARALREVAAKRAILGLHARAVICQGDWHEDGQEQLAEDVLRQLATVYSDHPDYRPEWAPQ